MLTTTSVTHNALIHHFLSAAYAGVPAPDLNRLAVKMQNRIVTINGRYASKREGYAVPSSHTPNGSSPRMDPATVLLSSSVAVNHVIADDIIHPSKMMIRLFCRFLRPTPSRTSTAWTCPRFKMRTDILECATVLVKYDALLSWSRQRHKDSQYPCFAAYLNSTKSGFIHIVVHGGGVIQPSWSDRRNHHPPL
jgi:hypothetical protein